MIWPIHALLFAAALASTAPLPAPVAEGRSAPPSTREARKILAAPKGSLSFALTNSGRLDHAVSLPAKGRGWRFLSFIRGRGTHFGTREMAGFIRETGKRLHAAMPGSVMGVGNVSLKEGGKSPWHQSHQSGRDVDIVFFVVDGSGKSKNPTRFVGFGEDLRSQDSRKRWAFDVPRNLALVRAMLADTTATVQWIFVADWLKQAMLAEATSAGASQEDLDRLDAVMHQPSDSNPHDDHFHVRIYCSTQDRLHGCLERGPLHEWADLGDEAFAGRVAALSSVLGAAKRQHRVAAATKLGEIRAVAAVPALLAGLGDADSGVRDACLVAIRRVADASAVPGLLVQLLKTTDPRWAVRIFGVALSIPHEEAKQIALSFASNPDAFLHPLVLEHGPTGFHVAVARVLGRHGRAEVVPALLDLLGSTSAKVRGQAETSLMEITARTVAGSARSRRAASRARAVTAWLEFWDAHKGEPWPSWVRGSLMAAGYRLGSDLRAVEAIETLIKATGDRRPHISRNASRLLSELTDHAVDPYSRSPRNKRRHWSRWWELNAESWTSVATPPHDAAGAAP